VVQQLKRQVQFGVASAPAHCKYDVHRDEHLHAAERDSFATGIGIRVARLSAVYLNQLHYSGWWPQEAVHL